MDKDGVTQGNEVGSPAVVDHDGIGRSRFLAAAGGTLIGLAAGLTSGADLAAAATKYPGAIDKSLTPEEAPGAVIAVETALGINPSGPFVDVASALGALFGSTNVITLAQYGAKGDGSTNDAPAIREAFKKAGELAIGGAQVIVKAQAGAVYKLSTGVNNGGAVEVPRGITGRLEFHGEGCKFVMTANCRRLFDCISGPKEHESIRHFLAQDFLLDQGGFHKETEPELGVKKGVREHIVFGNEPEGTIQYYLQFEDITLRRWKVINAWSHEEGKPEASLTGVFIRLKQKKPLAEEPTEDVARRIFIEDWEMEGGLVAVDVGGECEKQVEEEIEGKEEKNRHSDLANVVIDNVVIRNWYHNVGGAFAVSLSSSSIQIGHYCIGGNFRVENGWSEYAGDVAVEIDYVAYAVVQNVVAKNARNSHFLSPGMGKPLSGPGVQYFRNCRAIRERTDGEGVGFLQAEGGGKTTEGKAPIVHYDSCSFYSNRPETNTTSWAWFAKGATPEIAITNCRADIEGIEYGGASATEAPIVTLSPTVDALIRIRGLDLRFEGSRKASAGELKPIFLTLAGKREKRKTLDISSLTISDLLKNGSKGPRYVKVNSGKEPMTFHGNLDLRVLADGETGEARAAYVYPGTKIDGALYISGDLRGMKGELSQSVVFDGELPESEKAKIKRRNLISNVLPIKPTAITVPASGSAYLNLDGYVERVTVRGGTVELIQLSNDGINWIESGATSGIFVLDHGDSIKVKYSVKPTMEKLLMP
jgi:hypothetical protein